MEGKQRTLHTNIKQTSSHKFRSKLPSKVVGTDHQQLGVIAA